MLLPTEALKWFHKAAEQGDPLAQSHLGILYAKGKGVPQDYVQAHKWFSLAASRWFRGERHKEKRQFTIEMLLRKK